MAVKQPPNIQSSYLEALSSERCHRRQRKPTSAACDRRASRKQRGDRYARNERLLKRHTHVYLLHALVYTGPDNWMVTASFFHKASSLIRLKVCIVLHGEPISRVIAGWRQITIHAFRCSHFLHLTCLLTIGWWLEYCVTIPLMFLKLSYHVDKQTKSQTDNTENNTTLAASRL